MFFSGEFLTVSTSCQASNKETGSLQRFDAVAIQMNSLLAAPLFMLSLFLETGAKSSAGNRVTLLGEPGKTG